MSKPVEVEFLMKDKLTPGMNKAEREALELRNTVRLLEAELERLRLAGETAAPNLDQSANIAQIHALEKQLEELRGKLKLLQEESESVQVTPADVPNAQRQFNGLHNSIQQMAREMPSLAMGPQMFFLAISNNLPIFTDELARARKEYDELQKSGKKGTPVWKQVLSSLFSWQTAMTTGIMLLVMYGDEIWDWTKNLFSAKKGVDEFNISLKEMTEIEKDGRAQMVRTRFELKSVIDEIKNFTGPVQARNFEIFRELLDKNHMLDQAHDFFRASGALTAIEYKDVIEAQLRTYLKGGFQLLSLNDFTGQGYAPVGILDPFWNTKGLITPEKWREFCAPTVALLRFDKRALYNDEVFEGKAEIYNYGPALLKNAKINWRITDSNGKTLKSGKLKTQTVGKNGVFPLGSFSYALDNITEPQKLTVHLSVAHVKNSWDIWVYPRHSNLMQSTSEVLYTTVFDEKAKQHLADGKKVVLCPKPSKVKGRKSVFHNHFWNPIMFKWPPMTIGCLIHDDQPVFEHFITSYHTDWQWWDILENAKVIEMKDAPAALRPFIQVIDHYDNNEKLGIGFEAKVKKGSLLVLAVDTQKNINERPATQQLLESIDRYVKSDKFAPQITVDESYIESFLKK